MNNAEINTFIETMEELGDKWEFEDVDRVYGNKTLNEALCERRSELDILGTILNTTLNL